MKTFFTLLFCLSFFYSGAQNAERETSVLMLEKKASPTPVLFAVKPTKSLQVKVHDSRHWLTLQHYTLVGDSALVFSSDTVALTAITAVKAKIKGSALRKGGGVFLIIGGTLVTAGFLGVGLVSLLTGPSPCALLALPGMGVIQTGITLAGARRFNTEDKWNLVIL